MWTLTYDIPVRRTIIRHFPVLHGLCTLADLQATFYSKLYCNLQIRVLSINSKVDIFAVAPKRQRDYQCELKFY